ncbi:NUDIX hydrolase [Citrobacter braakii]|uniref:NUDIX hydrolase n=1 Tax=Citrobacter braakii TaxID=57706 RepID=UPI0040397AEC
MPAPNEDLKAKLLEVVEALATSQGVTPQQILSTLNDLPPEDLSKVDDGKVSLRTAAADEDQNDMVQAQVKADSAYTAVGRKAPQPFSGEKAMDYRKRALIGLQGLAKDFSEVNIRSISDSATLNVLEDQIYKAAKADVDWAMDNTPGYLHKTVRMDEAGRRITTWHGDPNAWLSAFKTPPRRLVRINQNSGS